MKRKLSVDGTHAMYQASHLKKAVDGIMPSEAVVHKDAASNATPSAY